MFSRENCLSRSTPPASSSPFSPATPPSTITPTSTTTPPPPSTTISPPALILTAIVVILKPSNSIPTVSRSIPTSSTLSKNASGFALSLVGTPSPAAAAAAAASAADIALPRSVLGATGGYGGNSDWGVGRGQAYPKRPEQIFLANPPPTDAICINSSAAVVPGSPSAASAVGSHNGPRRVDVDVIAAAVVTAVSSGRLSRAPYGVVLFSPLHDSELLLLVVAVLLSLLADVHRYRVNDQGGGRTGMELCHQT